MFYIVQTEGLVQRDNIKPNDQLIFANVKSSPLRNQCHTGGSNYLKPMSSC